MSVISLPSGGPQSLREAISALVAAAPPTATVTVSWLASLLEGEEAAGQAHGPTVAQFSVDLTVQQVAAEFSKGHSTIRTWIARGELPGAYRLHGREWRIPRTAIDAMQRRESELDRQPAKKRPVAVSELGEWRRHRGTPQVKSA